MDKFLAYFATVLLAFGTEVSVGSNEMVAFLCNRPSMFKTSAGWVKDDSTDCLRRPEDILEYCRKVYPDLDVRNIVEANAKEEIANWCDFGVPACDRKFTVRPFQCLVGPFQSDALLVPEHCVFDHVHNSRRCSSHDVWNQTALQSCQGRGYQLQSFAILQPCDIDKFNGVEFVCCPRDRADESTQPASTEAPKTNSPPPVATSPQAIAVDEPREVYQENLGGRDGHWNEHEYFVKARSDLQRQHHEKISQMMKEWSTARERVQEMRAKDAEEGEKMSQEITSRFQKMYEAAEREAGVEKRQLTSLHQQRIQAEMDDRKRRLLQKFVEAVDVDQHDIDAPRVLKALIRYVKALQKDRIHIMNRYRHQLQSSPADAEANRPQMVGHLASSDHQLTAAIHMLDRLTIYKDKIVKQIHEYLNAYHAVDANILALFGPLETTTTTSTTTTPPPTTTTTTRTIDAILADEDSYDDYSEYYDDYGTDGSSSEPRSWQEQQFKQAMQDKRIFEDEEEDSSTTQDEESIDEDEDEDIDDDDDDDYYEYDDEYEDEKPWSAKQSETSSTDEVGEQGLAAAAESTGREDDDETDAFDYVRVQLPMGGHGDNIGKSQLTAQEPYMQKLSLKQSVETFSAVPLGIAVGCITVFVVIVAGIVVMRRRGASRRYGQRRGAGAPARLPLDPAASPEERHVAAMQMTGYENPTYKYFESSAASA